jgi:hypothetical protein
VDDIKDSLFPILSSQKHMSYLQGVHAAAVTELAVPPPSGKKTKGKSKKSAAERNDADLDPFKKTVEQAPLRIWKSVMSYRRLPYDTNDKPFVYPSG